MNVDRLCRSARPYLGLIFTPAFYVVTRRLALLDRPLPAPAEPSAGEA